MELKGYDGTDMNHPGYKLVCANLAREVGLYKKQNSGPECAVQNR